MNEIELKLTVQQVELLINLLAEHQYKVVAELIMIMQQQAKEQIK